MVGPCLLSRCPSLISLSPGLSCRLPGDTRPTVQALSSGAQLPLLLLLPLSGMPSLPPSPGHHSHSSRLRLLLQEAHLSLLFCITVVLTLPSFYPFRDLLPPLFFPVTPLLTQG